MNQNLTGRIVTSLSYRARSVINPLVVFDRALLANEYVHGNGIEIGGLHHPTPVPRDAHVRYVDRLSTEDLLKHYPERADDSIVKVDIVDDGARLATVEDESQDFVIANHVIEHCPDPLDALSNWHRVLKTGGVLFMAVPDKRYTFDADREVTPIEHVLRDHREGAQWSRAAHYREWTTLVNKLEGEAAEREIEEFMQTDYSIHFHVWTQREMLELLLTAQKELGLNFDVETLLKHGEETIFVLRKMERESPKPKVG